jgi:hypothetical protein
MKKLVAALCVLAPMYFFPGCGPGEPEKASFKGTWQHTSENGIANTKEEVTVTATVDRDRFRLETKIPGGGSSIAVFDGTTLYSKYESATPNVYGSPLEGAGTPSVSAEPMTSEKVGPHRFWANAYRTGHGEPGGTIAGRDTLLYKAAERRPDGEFSRQEWVDAKTGVLLKSIDAIYSSQIRSMVRQETWECQTIDYSPPNEADFQKP